MCAAKFPGSVLRGRGNSALYTSWAIDGLRMVAVESRKRTQEELRKEESDERGMTGMKEAQPLFERRPSAAG